TGHGGNIELYDLEANTGFGEEGRPPRNSRPSPIIVPHTDIPKPKVMSRKAWRALPAEADYIPMTPDRISVHHTEAAQPFSKEDAIQEMQVIQRFHQKGRGWIDIGYHFVIDGSGT